jgi:rhodanese-related sulfurtransferase
MSHNTIQPKELQIQLQSLSQPHAPLVVDIRSRRQFRRNRIPGSHNIAAARLISTEFPDRDLVLVGAHEDKIPSGDDPL